MKKQYNKNKAAKVGERCVCPSCNTSFVKASYQQAFCKTQGGTVCKDKYWNTVTPEKRNNTTRISPANAAWKKRQENERCFYGDIEDDMGWDAHKDRKEV